MIKSQIYPAVVVTLLLTLFTGILFPAAIWATAQLLFPYQANGSFVEKNGQRIGSELIGQNFSSQRYFHSRPSAAGAGYDANSSSGTNLGPTSKKLFAGIQNDPSTPDIDESFAGVADLAKAYRQENGLPESALVPVDAVTRSASGLDPHITPHNARLQAPRVARARQMEVAQVMALIESSTEDRFLKLFGEPRVNVLKLNLALDQ